MSKFESRPNNATGAHPSDLSAVRQRTEELIRRAIHADPSILLESPPSSGKTRSIFKLASKTDETLVYLTKREDLYAQAVDKCKKFDCSYKLIPSPHRNCDSFDEDSPSYNPEAVALYELGITAPRIHALLDLDCQPGCEYIQRWDSFEKTPVDVIIGHYKHAYVSSVTEDRVVVIDEFPGGAYEREFNNADRMVTRFLRKTPQMPFDNITNLLQHRDDPDQRETAYEWFARHGVGTSDSIIIDADTNDRYHIFAPFLVFTLLNTVEEENGIEIPWFNVAPDGIDAGFKESPKFDGLEQDHRVVVDQERLSMYVLTPPDLSGSKGVVGLDGTPTPAMWDLVTGEDFEVRRTLQPEMVNEYIHDALGITIKQTSEHLKPYSGGHITSNRDEAILYGIEVAEGQKAALIAPDKALDAYRNEGILDYANEWMNYAEVLSSNDFEGKEIGAILGAPHPGDDIIKKWAGYFGVPVGVIGQGMGKTYIEPMYPIFRTPPQWAINFPSCD